MPVQTLSKSVQLTCDEITEWAFLEAISAGGDVGNCKGRVQLDMLVFIFYLNRTRLC